MGYEDILLYNLSRLRDLGELNILYGMHEDLSISLNIVDKKTKELVTVSEDIVFKNNEYNIRLVAKNIDKEYRKRLMNSCIVLKQEKDSYTFIYRPNGRTITFFSKSRAELFRDYLNRCITKGFYFDEDLNFHDDMEILLRDKILKYAVRTYIKNECPSTKYYKGTKYNKRLREVTRFIYMYIKFNRMITKDYEFRIDKSNPNLLEDHIKLVIDKEKLAFYI